MYVHEITFTEHGRGQQFIQLDDFLRKTMDNELLGLLDQGILIILYLSKIQYKYIYMYIYIYIGRDKERLGDTERERGRKKEL